MELQALFQETIQDIQELHPGYEDHASDVWLVKTESEEVVVRSSRMSEEPTNEFWWGCNKLFGIDPRHGFGLEHVNNTLCTLTSIPIPKVLRKGFISSRQFVVVEKLPGTVIHSFTNQSAHVLYETGKGLAHIHQFQTNYIGSPSGNFRIPLENFNQHLVDGMTDVVNKFYKTDWAIESKLAEMIELFKAIPTPQAATFVLVDMDPSQFLSCGTHLTGLVDTEAFVLAPRELDFVGLEYMLDANTVKDFRKGYETVMDIPDVSTCRLPYRYLYRLLSVQGSVPIDTWLQQEKLFL